MFPSATVVPTTSQHTSETEGVSFTWSPLERSPARTSVVFAGGGLGPQVKLGSTGLDLPPDCESTKPEQSENEHLFHGMEPSTSTFAQSLPGT
jgi:hypothetical protein